MPAASVGDVLVVAVNRDANVRRRKGSERPMVPHAEPPHPCRKCKCGKLVLLFPTSRPTVAQLRRMPPDMESEMVSDEVQLYLPLTGFL